MTSRGRVQHSRQCIQRQWHLHLQAILSVSEEELRKRSRAADSNFHRRPKVIQAATYQSLIFTGIDFWISHKVDGAIFLSLNRQHYKNQNL